MQNSSILVISIVCTELCMNFYSILHWFKAQMKSIVAYKIINYNEWTLNKNEQYIVHYKIFLLNLVLQFHYKRYHFFCWKGWMFISCVQNWNVYLANFHRRLQQLKLLILQTFRHLYCDLGNRKAARHLL